MNCQEIEVLKHAYADRELDLVRTTEIEHHLSGCRACSQVYENIRALSSALKSSDLYFKAPALLKRRLGESLGAANKDAPTLQRSNAPMPCLPACNLFDRAFCGRPPCPGSHGESFAFLDGQPPDRYGLLRPTHGEALVCRQDRLCAAGEGSGRPGISAGGWTSRLFARPAGGGLGLPAQSAQD